MVPLDLAREIDPGFLADRSFDAAIFCAGITSRQYCRSDPAESRTVNVARSGELARRLAASGAFIVYLSTNLVFDGTKQRPTEADPVCPSTEYGRQKAEMEALIREPGPETAAIIRLTKVVHAGLPLIAAWRRDLLAGRPVQAFDDVTCSLLDLREAAAGIALVAVRRAAGTWHFSNGEDGSYWDLARDLAQHLGAAPNLVRPAAGAAAWSEGGPRPAFAALDALQTSARLQVRFASSNEVIRRASRLDDAAGRWGGGPS